MELRLLATVRKNDMHTVQFRMLLVSLAVMAAGCGADQTSAASCNLVDLSCLDFTGNAITRTAAQVECTVQGGAFAEAACPTANRVGSCTMNEAGLGEIVIRFYAPLGVEDARNACASPGVFTPN
jgi:hypothetical protein